MKKSLEFYVIAHNIRSLLNVGSIFRNADAFGVTKLYLTGYTGTPDHPIHAHKLTKVSLGAEKFVPWEYHSSPVRLIKNLRLKHSGITIIGLENNVSNGVRISQLSKLKPKFPLVLVLGEEIGGIHKNVLKLCNLLVEIPMRGQKESLNVSVAFGVAAYEISRHFAR